MLDWSFVLRTVTLYAGPEGNTGSFLEWTVLGSSYRKGNGESETRRVTSQIVAGLRVCTAGAKYKCPRKDKTLRTGGRLEGSDWWIVTTLEDLWGI